MSVNRALGQRVKSGKQVLLRSEVLAWGFVFVCACVLAFYNLGTNPLSWQDEGAAMLVSKSIAKNGVYALPMSNGYETFGPVQSVGPTVLVPVALVFKVLGVGIFQARLVSAFYLVLTLLVFYGFGRDLFGYKTALLSLALLIGNPIAQFLFQGREVLGEVPSLGFFMGGAWLLYLGLNKKKGLITYLLAGLLMGASMVTKSSNAVIGFAALGILTLLDLFYFKQGYFKAILISGVVALATVLVWWAWQWFYFGQAVFLGNLNNLRLLGSGTSGFNLSTLSESIKGLLSPETGSFYNFWGFAALLYSVVFIFQKNSKGFAIGLLWLFSLLWLGYYFYSVPWRSYIFVTASLTSLFIAKFWVDLLNRLDILWRPLKDILNPQRLLNTGMAAALVVGFGFMTLYPLQSTLKTDVLTRDSTQREVAAYLEQNIPTNATVETWDLELGVITNLHYHYPDQIMLASVHATLYRNAPQNYALGAGYFQAVNPSYLVIGWFSRWTGIYDSQYVSEHGCLVQTFDDGAFTYQIYKMNNLGESVTCE